MTWPVRVVHQRQRLPLRLEPRQHLSAVHPGLDELHGDRAPDRLGLLGRPDLAHAALADRLPQLVRPDPVPRVGGGGDVVAEVGIDVPVLAQNDRAQIRNRPY